MPMQPQSPTAYSLSSLQQDLPEELFAWDFSRDVLGGLDQFVDPASSLESSEAPESDVAEASQTAAEVAGPSSSDTVPPLTATSRPRAGSAGLRKQRQNRLAQQRYRQRQKAQSDALDAQVAKTEARLQELKERQKQLEARNAVLESAASASLSESAGGEDDWRTLTSAAIDQTQTIKLTVLDNQLLTKSVDDVSTMPFTEFSTLYAAYAQKISGCLAAAASSPESDEPIKQAQRWTCECNALRVFLAVGNLKNFVAFSTTKLDGTMGPGANQLTDAWYEDILAGLQLTEAQQADMMFLRQLFYNRLSALSRERKELLRQVPPGITEAMLDASTRLADFNAIAQQLHDNSAAEFRAFMLFTSAYRRGILTGEQKALSLVKAFPYIADEPRLFEVLAAQRNEVLLTELTQPSGPDDLEYNTNWLQVTVYLRSINRHNLTSHVPLSVAPVTE